MFYMSVDNITYLALLQVIKFHDQNIFGKIRLSKLWLWGVVSGLVNIVPQASDWLNLSLH